MRPIKLCSLALPALFVMLAACHSGPERDRYAPPVQRQPMIGPDTSRVKHFIAMNDPDAEQHLLRDVRGLEANHYRWTAQRPLLRFVLPVTEHLKFTADFAVNGEAFKATGPFHIQNFVNGRELANELYDAPGEKHFEKDVPAAWLVKGGDTVVAMEIDKVYTAADGAKLGVTLVRAGFKD